MKRTMALDALGVVSVLIPLVMFGACGSGGNGGAGGSAGGTGKVDAGSGGSSGSTLDANVPSGGSGGSTRDAGSADVPATSDTAIALDTGSPVDGAADWSGVDAPATSDAGGRLDAGQSDPYFSNVVLLMHFDGANGATNFVDVKGHAVTPMGSAALATARSVYGGASGYFDGASAYLKVAPSDDWNFAANDFTVELSVSFAGGISGQLQIPALLMLGPPLGWQLLYNRAYPPADLVPGTVLIMFSTEPGPGPVGGPQINTSPDQVVPSATWTPSADTWCHLAVVRHGSDFLFFVNGNLIGTRSLGPDGDLVDWLPGSGWESTPNGKLPLDVSINPSDGNLVIGSGLGSNGDPNPQTYFGGYIDEARITKGVARYTTNFTPPTGPFPDQ